MTVIIHISWAVYFSPFLTIELCNVDLNLNLTNFNSDSAVHTQLDLSVRIHPYLIKNMIITICINFHKGR